MEPFSPVFIILLITAALLAIFKPTRRYVFYVASLAYIIEAWIDFGARNTVQGRGDVLIVAGLVISRLFGAYHSHVSKYLLRLKRYHRIGIGILAVGVAVVVSSSLATGPVASALAIIGVGLIFVGLLIFSPVFVF